MKNSKLHSNGKFLLTLLVLCFIIPHLILSLLKTQLLETHLSPYEVEVYSNFFVCQWMPFWLVCIPYLRLQKQDNFSIFPAIAASVIVLTYIFQFDMDSVMTIALTVPLILGVEFSAMLKHGESSSNVFLRSVAEDRKMLRAFFFWSIVFPAVIFISCNAATFETTVVSPFQMLPIPGVLLYAVFRQRKSQAPTIWTIIGMLAIVPLSLFLVTIGPMEKFKVYHLMSLSLGFTLLFLILVLYNLDRWKKVA